MRRAIFLDRDGTLNLDTGYAHKREDWIWLPGARESLKRFYNAGWTLVVVSNQSGIGRGYFKKKDLERLENWLNEELKKDGVTVSAWKYCPHTDADNCECRKPKPGLIISAARDLGIDLKKSWMIGDRLRDIYAGLNAGVPSGLLKNAAYPEEWKLRVKSEIPLKHWESLSDAANYILNSRKRP